MLPRRSEKTNDDWWMRELRDATGAKCSQYVPAISEPATSSELKKERKKYIFVERHIKEKYIVPATSSELKKGRKQLVGNS